MRRRSRLWRADLGVFAVVAAGTQGCVDRAISNAACEDGRLDAEDICFGDTREFIEADFDPLALRLGDFDGDAHVDALILGVDPEVEGALFRGSGTGSFGPAEDARIHGCSAYPIVGDVDGDGATDLLVSECGASALLFAGGPTGFAAGESVFTGMNVRTSSVIDIDGDHRLDLVMLGADASARPLLGVAHGTGDGAFETPETSPLADAMPGFDPFTFALGDIDEDGSVDALLHDTTQQATGFAVAPGRAGGFAGPQPVLRGIAATTAVLRDVDRDDTLDVLVRIEDQLVFFRGDGVGSFAEADTTLLPDPEISFVGLGDLDLDGDIDFLLAMPEDPTLEVWRGLGDGSFERAAEIHVVDPPDQVLVADVNEDGAPDLVVGAFTAGVIRVLLAEP